MAKQTIGVGTVANDGTGDTIRTAMNKVNNNFAEIYNAFGDGTTITEQLPNFSELVNGNLLYVNAAGQVASLPGVSYETDGRIIVETSTSGLVPDFQIISSNNSILSLVEYGTESTTAALSLYKRRGTVTAPLEAVAGDLLGVISIIGRNTTTYSRLSWHASSTTDETKTDTYFRMFVTVDGVAKYPIQSNEDGSIRISDAYNLPQTDGTSGQVLSTDGTGSLQWVDTISKTQLKQVVADSVDFADFQARIAAL